LLYQKINVKFLLASLKTLTNSEKFSVSCIKFLVRLSFTLIGSISPVYIHCRLSEQISEQQAAFGTNFRVTGGFQIAGTSPLNRVTGMIFTIRM
jgi:hypothetical protein